jgi:hypothetical protein
MHKENLSGETSKEKIISAFFMVCFLLVLVTPIYGQNLWLEDNYTYSITEIETELLWFGSTQVLGTLKLKVPTHLLVDKENEFQAVFERKGGCLNSNSAGLAFYLYLNYSTDKGVKSQSLDSIDFSIDCSSNITQVKTFKIIVPSYLYNQFSSNNVTVYIGRFKVIASSSVSVKSQSIVNEIPAKSVVVKTGSSVTIATPSLPRGYIMLQPGNVTNFSINVTARDGLINLQEIEIESPAFARVSLDTSLPLRIPPNETRGVNLKLYGSGVGAGILKLTFIFYDGNSFKKAILYVPIVVGDDKLVNIVKRIDILESNINSIQSQISKCCVILVVSTLIGIGIGATISWLLRSRKHSFVGY